MNLHTIHSAIGRTIQQQGRRLACATPAAIAVTLVSATVLWGATRAHYTEAYNWPKLANGLQMRKESTFIVIVGGWRGH